MAMGVTEKGMSAEQMTRYDLQQEEELLQHLNDKLSHYVGKKGTQEHIDFVVDIDKTKKRINALKDGLENPDKK
ncbi:hypothetical protein COT97_05840 [Candidatus Falkowbacteria bacterium CG10_big_fil_rev_8_21_14_0_10_39_11]|uniref:Uncharacterized protein n=1 Tax=Candidatus Falkowbacteria bacterium CG10_big_fil_rev_8_21_14_0_10_39_11 TaxID=1974565 RepID=A0A2H0V5F8_9BACT|nr:MAG: hypothetical protein COT97_05840 [Candidatus Falkowbacteria bacterium CG10_big_fil_rev_8_21_14_0_10_39_11]